ncbi:hypothetical protein SI65_10058 [Aspergillus cristatus]|uniref:Myb-like domain-containing protein n=1 Tax=Aspergillus cristatus TaxID=573508 RepID=A0A1E3B0W9_ASPCR|nr:hypothetical protein SI65_10058 [Aspergillus cristatus]
MPLTPSNETIASPLKTGELDPHETLAVMSDTENVLISGIKSEQGEEEEPPVPITPKKRGKKTTDANGDEEQDSPTKKTKKSPSKKTGALGPIPTTLNEASAEDKMIIRLKEVEGKTWAEIRKIMEDITGAKLGGSTVQVRYTRMKANFVVFDKEDEDRLLQSKKEIEERFESEKWQKIANSIEVKGGNKYPSAAIQKKFKELSKRNVGSGVAATFMEEDE